MNVNALKSAMSEKGVSQNELARRVGCSPATVNNIVSGKREPRIDVLRKICKELGKKPQELW